MQDRIDILVTNIQGKALELMREAATTGLYLDPKHRYALELLCAPKPYQLSQEVRLPDRQIRSTRVRMSYFTEGYAAGDRNVEGAHHECYTFETPAWKVSFEQTAAGNEVPPQDYVVSSYAEMLGVICGTFNQPMERPDLKVTILKNNDAASNKSGIFDGNLTIEGHATPILEFALKLGRFREVHSNFEVRMHDQVRNSCPMLDEIVGYYTPGLNLARFLESQIKELGPLPKKSK